MIQWSGDAKGVSGIRCEGRDRKSRVYPAVPGQGGPKSRVRDKVAESHKMAFFGGFNR